MVSLVSAMHPRTEWSTWRTWRIPADSSHVRQARAEIRQAVAQFGDDVADRVEAASNELMANVVVHTSSPDMTIRVRDTGTALRVECRDDGSPATGPSPRDPLEEYGKGLMLVRALTTRQGHLVSEGGRTVWFEIDHL